MCIDVVKRLYNKVEFINFKCYQRRYTILKTNNLRFSRHLNSSLEFYDLSCPPSQLDNKKNI